MASILTHNGVLTIRSLRTGAHRTFKLCTQPADAEFAPGARVVSMLTGPDNETDYRGFAFLRPDGRIAVWKKYCGDTSWVQYATMLERLDAHVQVGNLTVEWSTSCRRCNRRLTTPESIELGIGPECAKRES